MNTDTNIPTSTSPSPANTKKAREFRFFGSERVLNIIRLFSPTEKVIFGVLAAILCVTSIMLAIKVNDLFRVPVPAHGGTYTEAEIGLPRLVNPVIAISDVDRDLSTLIYAGLLKDHQGTLVPSLARSYKVSDDGLTYTFTLRDDVRFHDGTQVTTDDVEFTIAQIQDPAIQSPRRADWKDVVMKKISSSEIEFTLKQPYAPFLNNFTLGILPKHIWKNVSAEQFVFSQYNTEPIGAGPYQLGSIERDSGGVPVAYHLSPFSRYVSGEPYISNLIIRFYPNEKSAIDSLTSGGADSLAAVSSKEAATVASTTSNTAILSTPLPRIFAIFLNQNSPLFTNKEVRQALAMSIDKEQLVKEVLDGYGVPIDGPVPFGALGGLSTSTTPTKTTATATTTISGTTASTTQELARAVLEKAGWTLDSSGIYVYIKPTAKKATAIAKTTATTASSTASTIAPLARLEFSIATADSPDLKQTAEFVREEWRKIGADVTIKVFESGDLTQNIIRNRKYDAVLFGEVIDKDLDLYAFWHSSQRNAPGLNLSMYVNSKTDKLLEDARRTSDDAVRLQKYSDFEEIVKVDVPAVFLYSPDFIYIIPKSVHGVSLGQVTTPWDRWNSVSSWYINTDKVWKFLADKIVINK